MTWRIIALWCLFTGVALAQPTPTAKSVLVIDVDTNEVLFEKSGADIRPIASITKLMNALIVLEIGQPLDELIEITAEDVKATVIRGRQTGGNLALGTKLTRAEMIHLSLMNSQNRAAHALARVYPGGMEVFVAHMNAKAIELGMLHTTFTDPTGLFNTNVSTAADLAKLVGAASQVTIVRDFSTSTSFQTTQYVRKKLRVVEYATTNRLSVTPDWNLIIQKTGYITDAGRCMVVMATFGVRRVIMILLDTPSANARVHDAISLRYWIEHNEVMPAPAIVKKLIKRKKRK
jgi:serine-type D-Ala-D-Ala endopeptidase (penicillin-binding protein 7)